MSYILDALRRADRERKLGSTPRVDQLATPVETAPRSSAMPWLLALNAIVVLGLLIWFVQRDDVQPADAIAEPEQLAEVNEPVYAPPPEIYQLPPPPADEPELWAQQAVEELNRPPESPPAPSIEAVMAPESVPEPVSAPEAVVATEPELPEQIPTLRDMPIEFRKTLPSITLNTHFFSENAARRFVIIDLEKYREGDQISGGPEILEITRDGILFEYRERRFTLPR